MFALGDGCNVEVEQPASQPASTDVLSSVTTPSFVRAPYEAPVTFLPRFMPSEKFENYGPGDGSSGGGGGKRQGGKGEEKERPSEREKERGREGEESAEQKHKTPDNITHPFLDYPFEKLFCRWET